MVDPTTVNKLLAQPGRATDVDTWTGPINGNTDIVDNSFGGVATVALSSSPVSLSSAQYKCVFLRFTGALNANVPVTLPAVGSFYTVINDTTNSSAFYVTLKTTVAGSKQVGIPTNMTDIMTDGSDVRFRNLPATGAYWNFSGSSAPAWNSACTVPPWLYCDGSTFASSVYPTLSVILNSTTLPDLRGRVAIYHNGGTGRVTSSQGGVNGDAVLSAGGGQTVVLSSVNLPNISFPVTDPGHTHASSQNGNTGSRTTAGGPGTGGYTNSANTVINSAFTGISVNSGGSGTPFAIVPPSIVAGLTMIRAG